MAAELGPGWDVIGEGLSGRTTVHDDPIEGAHKNGRTYLTPCIQSHAPLDLVILMLGTNDLKRRFNQPASEVAMGIGTLIHDIRDFNPGWPGRTPEIFVVAPPPMKDELHEWNSVFAGAPSKSRELALEFEIMADSLEVHFMDAGKIAQSDPRDGFHLGIEAHRAIGLALAEVISAIGWPPLKGVVHA